MTQLLSSNPHVNVKNESGKTPLHILAVLSDRLSLEAFQLLVDAGADVNAKDKDGQTPLHVVATSTTEYKMDEASELAEVLLGLGAKINSVDNLGRTRLEICHETIGKDQEDVWRLKEINTLFWKNGADGCPCRMCNPAMPVDLFQYYELES